MSKILPQKTVVKCCGICVEWMTGWCGEKDCHTEPWEYCDDRFSFNINGRLELPTVINSWANEDN